MTLPTNTQLRLARAAVNLSADVVGDVVGISPDTITRIERGEVSPRTSTIRKLQEFYEDKNVQFADHGWIRWLNPNSPQR